MKANGTVTLTSSLILALAIAVTWAGVQPARAVGETIIFLHHSIGEGLIVEGHIRQQLTELGYEFYDHGYNSDGLRLADGSYAGYNFNVPDDNTDPDGLAAIFAQPLHDPPDNTFSYLMQYDVIIFKSCYPASEIWDDQMLADYMRYYLQMRDVMDRYPDHLFIPMTTPPNVPENSLPENAARARYFARWLTSSEYLDGHQNIAVFDLFDALAGEDNFLRPEYRPNWPNDAHPNSLANQEVGAQIVEFVDNAIRAWHAGELGQGAPPPPTGIDLPEPSATQAPSPEATPSESEADGNRIVFQVGISPSESFYGIHETTLDEAWDGGLSYVQLGGEYRIDLLADNEGGQLQERRRILMRFDIGPDTLPPDTGVIGARLDLFHWNTPIQNPTAETVTVHLMTAPWDEGTGVESPPPGYFVDGATWLLRLPDVFWETPGGDFDPTPISSTVVSPDEWYWESWDLTEAVRRWVSGEPNYGIMLRVHGPVWYSFFSSEFEDDPTLRPKLVIRIEPRTR